MEPITTSGVSLAKAVAVIKDFPLWLLTAITLSLIAFLTVPTFAGAVSENTRTWITVAAITSVIFAGCRFTSVVISHIKAHRQTVEARHTFHLTPITHQSFWGPTRQKDGTIVTQIRTELMAKNRTDKILHLLTTRVVRPKISGEVLHVMITTEADRKWYDVNCLPPSETIHTTVIILIRGFPGRVREQLPNFSTVLVVADDEGNEQRVKLRLKPITSTLIDVGHSPAVSTSQT